MQRHSDIEIWEYMIWNVDPVLLDFGPLQIRWYGLLFALGFVFGYLIIRNVFLREGRPEPDLDPLLWHMVLGVVLGARLGHCLLYEPGYYLSHPLEILMIWHGGLASHGGAIGVLISLFFYSRKRPDQPYLWVLDRVSLAVPLGGAMVRLGNFFNSEIVGRPTQVPWAVHFLRIDRLPRHPAQLYESAVYFLCFLMMMAIYRRTSYYTDSKQAKVNSLTKVKFYKFRPENGFFFGLFLVLVFGFRFAIEFVKEPQVAFENTLWLDLGQILSLPFVLLGLFLICRTALRGNCSPGWRCDDKRDVR